MTRFIVFEPPETGATPGPTDRARFVRDAFSGWAVLFPFLWLFRHGLILSGVLTLVLWVGFGTLADVPGLMPAAGALPLLLGFLVALEGPSLRAARLRRRGWSDASVVEADNEEEAAILYFADAPPQQQPSAERATVSRTASALSVRERAPVARTSSLLDPPRPR